MFGALPLLKLIFFRREIETLRQIEMEMGKEMEKSETEIAERDGAKEIKKCTVYSLE